MQKRWIWALPSTLALAACSGSEDVAARDVRVPAPEPVAGVYDLLLPEVVIGPGEEKQYCYYLDHPHGDLALTLMESRQGPGGHHIVILQPKEPKAAGTFEDCTDAQSMANFRAFALPDTELPPGHALAVPAGMHYAVQLHYVNAMPEPILARDVVRLHTMPEAEVQYWVATFATNTLSLEVPPGESEEVFDCLLPEDAELILLGGHMHEHGKRFEVEIGASEEELVPFYTADPWRPVFRDLPPVELFFEQPRPFSAGTIIRTRCVWQNDTGRTLTFPEEMCSSFGYVRGTARSFQCERGQVL